MAKWKPNMSESQRKKYNEYMRKRNLERKLEAGHVPKPHKYTPGVDGLYEHFGVAHLVPLPQPHLTEDQWQRVRKAHGHARRAMRTWLRDQLPADVTQRQFNVMFNEFWRRYVTERVLERINSA